MWESNPSIKPKDENYRLCCNRNDGCFMARWNGCRWISEPDVLADGYWNFSTLDVEYWLKTPIDE